ncbi:Hypothetical protein A7982_10292 [Minicystis rosea]|nr:Hypothetical protein A7982_10292 [Minicystis rosea]
MAIQIDEGLPGATTVNSKAFAKPSVNAQLIFNTELKSPGYHAHLVKFVSLSGTNTLSFRGVDLTNPDSDFGPNGGAADASNVFQVDLGQVKHVFREEPSSLVGMSEARPYLLLFLSDSWVLANDIQEFLQRARGGPKWPAGAGDLIKEIDDLNAKLAESRATQEMLKNALKHFAHTTSFNHAQKQLWDHLFSGLL